MNRRSTLALTTTTLLCLAVALPSGDALAQQKQQASFTASAENSKYTQQLNVDVGDVPNHMVRIFDLHRTYPNNAPVINGLKLVEESARGIADLTDGYGTSTLYGVYVMENGDKFFARSSNVIQSGSGRLATTQVGYITGGTGKFAGMQGIVRASGNFDPKSGFSENRTDIEYSIGK
jgi:hypothetical protein